ncbi:MAG: hypothetical protein E7295_10915 [Lachnospiraceae bacterium]|jgi:Tfp pilus assembly protein PilE|nr:hypothetical protein [Lachnospiraceae bacterium]
MKKYLKLFKDNRGASLIAVLVSIAVVSVIGAVITQLTITNIQMKEIERQAKTNFYDAEHVMNDLAAGLNKMAAVEMEKAYNKMLAQYRTVVEGGGSAKKNFSKYYLEYMTTQFTPASAPSPTTQNNTEGTEILYQRGKYDLDKVKGAFLDATLLAQKDTIVVTPATETQYFADYEKGIFILENVAITWDDDLGNATTIKTDIVFHTPDLNFDGSKLVKEFMRYSLIADVGINVNTGNIDVDGNVYAGHEGIYTSGSGTALFKGKKVITRGDIVVNSMGKLTVGNVGDLNRTQIWAENIIMNRTASTATSENHPILTLAGNIYVSDDLELNGGMDEVILKGKYYGYNFQKNYDSKLRPEDPKYSSAIVINGKKSKLDLTGLNHLTIAGRTYIGMNEGTTFAKAVPLGESMGVRTSQIAYFVPTDCMADEDNLEINETAYKNYIGITDSSFHLVADYLMNNSTGKKNNVIKYYYSDGSGGPNPYMYFLNFKSEEAANKYYAVYYNAKNSLLNTYAKSYLADDALKLDDSTLLTLRGDILYRNASDATNTLREKIATIDSAYWDENKAYFNSSADNAKKYFSLQVSLEDNRTDIPLSSVRLEDKTANTIFNALINAERLNAFFAAHETDGRKYIHEWDEEGGKKKILAIVDGDFEVTTAYTGGLIIATGNVKVSAGTSPNQFAGTIISKNTINFSDGATVEADEVLVSQLLSKDVLDPDPKFAMIFEGYESVVEAAMGEASIDKYLTFEGWTKTAE